MDANCLGKNTTSPSGRTGKEEDPYDDPRLQVFGFLLESTTHLIGVLNAELEQCCGLPLTWFEVLLRLRRSENYIATMGEIAHTVALTSGGVTRLIDRIEEAGLVERIMCPSDRRVVYVHLTAQGEASLSVALGAHLKGLDSHIVAKLTSEQFSLLKEITNLLRESGTTES